MLSFSSKSKYGLLATLSLAEHYGQGLLQMKDISRQQNIPLQYLGQIFNLLVKADIIKSVRGKNGGYQLSRTPSLITALEILEILEGGIELVEKENITDDAIQELLHLTESKIREVFNVSLADLLTRQQKKEHILLFDI
jgi:Rrf2 family protein